VAHSSETLVRMSGHLAYEIEMFAGTAWYLQGPADDTVPDRAVAEAFAAHARVLLDFLYEKPKDDTIGAASYVEGWKRPLPHGVHAKKIRKAERLVPLTTRRAKHAESEHEWRYDGLLDAMRADLLAFVKEAPVFLVQHEFADRVHAALDQPDPAPEPVPEPEPVEVVAVVAVVEDEPVVPAALAELAAVDVALVETLAVVQPASAAEPLEPEPEPDEAIHVAPEPEPEPIAAEPEPVAAEPTPEPVAPQPDPEPEPPVAEAAPEPAAPAPDPYPDPRVTPVPTHIARDEFGAVVPPNR
jgi:hypothetical protein